MLVSVPRDLYRRHFTAFSSVKDSTFLRRFVTHDDGSRGARVFTDVCLSVCLSVCLPVYFLHDIPKIDAARITKLDAQMFHDESRKPIYPWGQTVKGQGHE